MITLEGRSICERQKELNLKVNEAAENKVDLQELNCVDNSDIDRIFKIDLASKYRNADYILEELKSGDSLYVSRALKCEWLYGSDYAHLINPDYLHHHIFPKMSFKMKKKTLSTISIHVRDEIRTQLFYEYCMNTKMRNSAFKFLIFTSETYKNELMNDKSRFIDLCNLVEIDYFKKFIGNSFTLADTYGKIERPVGQLSYLYSLNEDMYLTLLEMHTKTYYYRNTVGVKMSRSILKKHKDRVIKRPLLYINMINRSELIKYSTSEDAQVYAVALLPEKEPEFWCDYFRIYGHILDLIKTPSIFEYVKKIFTEKYNTEFEMSKEFYRYDYYKLMTFEERETWALRHLQEQLDVIPEDENYKWYEFVAFAKSFKEIKSQIYIATDLRKRSELLKILVKSAKTQRELEELLNYYYNRHVNEKRDKKLDFIKTVMERHIVLEFDDDCWGAFDLLLRSVDIYNTSRYWGHDDILTVSLIYHIINNKTLPDDLQTYLEHDHEYTSYLWYYLAPLNDERKDLVYNHVNQFLIGKISEFDLQEYSDAVKAEVRPYLKRSVELRRIFSKQDKYPETVIQYMKLDLENFKHIVGESKKTKEKLQITEGYLMRCLKEDASLIVEKLPLIKEKFNNSYDFRINLLLRRIKTFFSNDIAKQCLEFCKKTLYESLPDKAVSEYRAIFSIVFAIFQMGDEKIKLEILDKFAPTNQKIDNEIGYDTLYTQEAICRFQSYSRPPVPLSKTALYLKGDYVHHCNDMFDMYLANLPPTLRSEFINFLIDTPLSIQKRGMRLALQTFEASELKDLVSSVWKKSKNISLRQNLYLLLLNKVVEERGKTQDILYDLLKELTLTLHQDDAEEVFNCFSDYRIPTNLRSSYLETAWKTVAKLPEKKSNFQRKIRVVNSIASNMSLMDETFLVQLIHDHVQKTLCEQNLRPELKNGIVELNTALWDLTVQYIVEIPNETKKEKSLKLVETITKECFDHWNEDYNTGDLIFQVFFRTFVDNIILNSSRSNTKYRNVVHIFEYLLESFEKRFGMSEMYSYFWDWKLRLMMGKAVNGETSSDKEVCINFGLQLGGFIRELKDKNLCYISFFNKIVEKILCCMNDFDYENDPTLDVADVSILVACGLILTETFETYLLALLILPTNPTEILKTEYQEVIKKIKLQNNAELTAFMNDKFIYSDLKVRKFIM